MKTYLKNIEKFTFGEKRLCHKDPLPVGEILIRNGGGIKTENGTVIVSVADDGTVTLTATIVAAAGSIGTAELADLAVTAGKLADTLNLSSKAITFPPLLSSVAGLVGTFQPMLVQQALSGPGAVNLTTFYTAWTTTGADAATLADATVKGHLKKVKMIVDGGDGTLTFNGTATIVFADAGDYAILMWNGADWIPVELGNDADGATAPVYTPA